MSSFGPFAARVSSFPCQLAIALAYHVHQVGGEIKGTGVAAQKAQAKQAAAKDALQVRFPLHGL